MKAVEVSYRINLINVDIKSIMWLLLIFIILVFIVLVRINCVKIGYELYNMESALELKELTYQNYMKIKSDLVDRNRLYNAGINLGLELTGADKVIYVR